MDGTRFDGWTRALATPANRRTALQRLGGGALAGLLARLGLDEASAACGGDGKRCKDGGACCSGYCERRGRCAKKGKLTGKCRCRCKPERSPCTGFEGCCSRSCDFRVDGGTCSPCRDQGCASSNDCCGGETCQNNYCGGCRDRAVTCSGPSDCCFSDCDFHSGTRVCLSNFGGRCKRDVDCGNCYLRGNCDGACFNGQCLV